MILVKKKLFPCNSNHEAHLLVRYSYFVCDEYNFKLWVTIFKLVCKWPVIQRATKALDKSEWSRSMCVQSRFKQVSLLNSVSIQRWTWIVLIFCCVLLLFESLIFSCCVQVLTVAWVDSTNLIIDPVLYSPIRPRLASISRTSLILRWY